MEDEDEWPYLVSEKRDNYTSKSSYSHSNSSKLYETAIKLIDDKELDEALTLINMLIDRNPEDGRYWNLKGNVYYYFGNNAGIFGDRQYEESLKCYNIAIKLNPSEKILKNNKANLLLDYANIQRLESEYVPAIHKIDEALSLFDKNNTDNSTFARAWNIKGLCYHAMGSREAFKCYDEALKYAPGDEVIKGNINDLRHYQGIDNEYFYG